MSLPAKRLRELLDYDPTTGLFTWRVDKFGRGRGGNARKGNNAGTINNGYRRIKIDGTIYRAARLAVLWMTGKFPPFDVDHINLKRNDDRWINLRQATRQQNKANGGIQRQSKTHPYKGVSWIEQKQKYYSYIGVNNRRIYLGRFDTPEEAHAAYLTAAKKFFGKFARSG